jgi:hypothetical protein
MNLLNNFFCLFYIVLFLYTGCKEKVIPPPPFEPSKWQVVPVLASLDVRYMIQHNGILYLAAVDPNVRLVCDLGKCHYDGDRGVVYKTTDAITWTKIKGFKITIGPMTFHDDTLYCLGDDSIYTMLPSGVWQTAFATPERLRDASADGDMVFIRDTLYAMQTFYGNAVETYRIHPDGSYEEVPGPDGYSHYAGAKYIKKISSGSEIVYLRPHWLAGGFFRFDGETYAHIENGLSPTELLSSPPNAMAVKSDTLFAGFGGQQGVTSAVIKILINEQWVQFHDTIPSSYSAYLVTPTLYAMPTAIAFDCDGMFIATNSQGVMEWKEKEGWVRMSEGLKPGHIPRLQEPDLRYPLPFLEYFKGRLIAAYGKPGYAPWGETGVYAYDLK